MSDRVIFVALIGHNRTLHRRARTWKDPLLAGSSSKDELGIRNC